MIAAGKTTDGKTVVSGVYKYKESVGIPLEVVLAHLKNKNLVVDWPDFIEAAQKNGSNRSSVIAKIENAIGDVFGSTYKEKLMKRLCQYYDASLSIAL